MSKTDALLLIALTWAVAAYIVVPKLWAMYFRRHPDFTTLDRCSKTGDGHPGDPINIVLAGDEADLKRAMTACGWVEAKPITVESSVRIAADTVLHRPDDAAPVSNLFLFGRKQDFAFEQPIKGGPGKRHHVRFWRWDESYDEQPAWFGAATFVPERRSEPHLRAGHPSHRTGHRCRARPPGRRASRGGVSAVGRLER